MRSKLITVVTAVASVVLVTQVAAADQVQEQLRLMEQRMAEMEDRLQATSDELRTAKATVNEQQGLLADSGLIEADDAGTRSGVGGFLDMVDVSGVVAASYNYRLIDSSTNGANDGNRGLFKTPNGNTFQVDQVWVTLDKTPTDESRGGFHTEFFTGTSANSRNFSGGTANPNPDFDETVSIYTAYASYLAPIGNGVQVNAGRLDKPFGAEVLQTNGNYFITQGAVFNIQPITHTGVSLATQLTDQIGFTAGVVNDVYSNSFATTDKDLAYYGRISYAGDTFGMHVGGIWGEDTVTSCGGSECETSVVDVTMTADPTENLSLWANFDWKHTSGEDTALHGDQFGVSGAGRFGITDTMGVATRVEYVHTEDSLNGTQRDGELVTLTGTIDKTLAEGLVARLELRWDTVLDDNNNATDFNFGNNDQLVALAQMYYEF